MAVFVYTARDRSGERVDGSVEAGGRRAALMQIERLGYIPVTVEESAPAKAPGKSSGKPRGKLFSFQLGERTRRRLSTREVLLFTSELSDLLASGMNLGNALGTLARRKSGGRGGPGIIAELRDEIVRGTSLSDALEQHGRSFSPLYVSMIRAGEASGALDEVMRRLVMHYERVQEVREKVSTALVYPCIVLLVGIATIAFLMTQVVPKFSTIFQEIGGSLPLSTRLLIQTSHFASRYGWIVLGVVIALGLLAAQTIKTERGRLLWHGFQLKLPLFKGVIASNAFARFARTLSILLTNGVPVLRALGIVEHTVGNAVLAREIHNARDRVTDGTTISTPLAAGKVFPPLITDMLAVGEEAGNMSRALDNIARRYESELDRHIKILTTALEPILMVCIAVFVGFVAIGLLEAVFSMSSGLNM